MPKCHAIQLRRRLQDLLRQSSDADEAELDANHPVVQFVTDAGLAQYAKALLSSGFDEMESLVLIDDQDIKDLGILRGHAAKLKKRLREYEIAFAPQHQFLHPSVFAGAEVEVPQKRTLQPAGPSQTNAASRGAFRMPAAASQQIVSEDGRSLVQQSWEQVKAIGVNVVAERLYKKSFELLPECMPLFPPEVRNKYREWSADDFIEEDDSIWNSDAMRRLWAKVINALGCTVAGLHDMGKLVPMLTKLGNRHINYGLQERFWPVVGKAVDLTLQELLGASYTPEVQQAWIMVYGFTSSIMIEGFRQAVAAKNQGLSLGMAYTVDRHVVDSESGHLETNDSASERSSAPTNRSWRRSGGEESKPGVPLVADLDLAEESEAGAKVQAQQAQQAFGGA
jgi:hypothetical protein